MLFFFLHFCSGHFPYFSLPSQPVGDSDPYRYYSRESQNCEGKDNVPFDSCQSRRAWQICTGQVCGIVGHTCNKGNCRRTTHIHHD